MCGHIPGQHGADVGDVDRTPSGADQSGS
jgi:hypothetical protein